MKRFISLLLTAVLMINFLCPAVSAEEIAAEEIISAGEMVSAEETTSEEMAAEVETIPPEETIFSEEEISGEEISPEENISEETVSDNTAVGEEITEEITSEETVYVEDTPTEEIISEDAEFAEEIVAEEAITEEAASEEATEEITDDISADNANSWRYKDGKPINDEYAIMPFYLASHPDATFTGIDVSKHQGQIDWAKVKQAGIDFAIIRCGYGEDKPQYDDIWWDYNASECERLGIPYGVYLYSYAESLTDALSEAEHVLRLIEGRNLSLPVFYDMEDEKLMGHDLAAMANVFCDRISEMGHPVGVYASLSWWDYHLINPCFDNWYRWVAQWNESCKYTGDYTIWQYSSTGAVSGIANNVDMNYLIGYPDDHKVWTEKLDTPKLTIDSAAGGQPLISWSDVQQAKEYQIWRKAGSDYYSLIDTVAETSFTDYGVTEGTEYAYMVKAVSLDNKTGNSYFSNAKGMKYMHRHTYKGVYCDVCGEKHPEADNYKGKVISVLGDSISTFEGYIPTDDGFNLKHLARYPQDNLLTDVNETWWMQVVNSFDAKLGINDSWRGATMCGAVPVTSGVSGELSSMSNLQRIRNLGSNGKPDVIMLYGGTNDIAHVEKIGTFNAETAPEEADLETLKWDNLADGYVNTILRLKHFYPDSDIIALLPAYTKNYYTEEKLTQANEVISKICEHYGVKYTSLTESGITADNLPDGIHPDATGMDYISDAVINLLLENCTVSAGENIVYKVEHYLTNVKAGFSYIKGISTGQSFEEELTAEDEISVKVSMAGADITSESFKDNKIFIENVTGDIVISAMSGYSIEEYIKPLPEKMCPEINIWQAVEHSSYYFTANNKWEIHSSGNVYSVTVPLSANDRIYATSFEKAGENGSSTTNGIRVVFFGDYGVIKNLSAEETYTEFSKNGYLTAPKGTVAISVPMWNNSDINEMYILTAEHDRTVVSGTEPTCIEKGVIDYKCAVCGLEYQENTDALGHSFTQYTLNGDGTKTSKCDRCNETETVKDKVYSGKYGDNIYWFIDSTDTLYVYGNGEMQNFAESDIPWREYRTIVKKAVIENTVTSIGTYAFINFTSLEKVIIPDSVTKIGAEAFDRREISFTVNKNSAAHKWLAENGFTNLDVKVALEGISLPESIKVTTGTAKELKAELYPADTTDAINLEWTVADESVAVYNAETGMIEALSPGKTTITVTETNSGYTATADVNAVLPKAVKIKVSLNEPIEKIGLQKGDSRKLVVTYELNGETVEIPSDRLDFKSMEGKKASKNVVVDENGVVTSCYTGTKSATATVTATLKNDSSKKATVSVKAIAKQVQELPLERPVVMYKDAEGVEHEAEVEQTRYGYIVVLPKEAVKANAVTFEIRGSFGTETKEAFAAAGAKLPAVKWSTSDSKAAKITAAEAEDLAEGEDYRTTVTIKKGSGSIYTVKATANDLNKATIAVDIDVRDYTPRLEKNSVTLNTYNDSGAEIKLYTAYDAALENYEAEVAMLIAEEDEEINVRLADENGNFYATYDKDSRTVTIHSNKIVKKGVDGYNSKNTYKFDLLINTSRGITKQAVTVKVANSMPKVTVKQSGTFNSFYKDSEVFTAVTAKGAVVTDVNLVESSTQTFVTEFVEATEEQKSGVIVSWADKNNPAAGYVKNSKKQMAADTSAVLEVELEGYRQPVSAKYTVGIKESAPKLVQSRSSSKYTYLNRNNEAITVTNQKTGELVNFDTVSWNVTSASEEYVTVSAEGEQLNIRVNETNKFTGKKPDHTVKVAIQETDWMKPVTVSHKVTVKLSKPTISPKETEVTLRSWYEDRVEMSFKASESNCPVPVFRFEGPEEIEFEQNGWTVSAKVKEGTEASGTYSYTVTPEIEVAEGITETLKAVKVKVKVGTTVPTLSFDRKSVTVSGTGEDSAAITAKTNDAECPAPVRYEFKADTKDKKVKAEAEKVVFEAEGWDITAGLDLNNLPKNASYKYKVTGYVENADGSETALKTASLTVKVSTPAAKLTLSKTSVSLNRDILEGYEIEPRVTEGYRITDVEIVPNTKAGEKLNVSYDGERNIITAKITDGTISKNSDKAYTYPVKVTAEIDKEGVTSQKVLEAKLSIKVISGDRKLSTKASGSIDLAVREKGISYTITGGSGFNYGAEMLEGKAVSLVGTYKDGEATKPISNLLEAGEVEYNEKGQPVVTVKAKADADLKNSTTYKYQLVTEIEEIGEVVSSTMSVKTKQSSLKLKASGDLTIYHKHEEGRITVTVTGPAGAAIAENGIQINTAKTASVLNSAVEFKDAADNGDGTWTIDYEVTRASLLKSGKSYKLVLAVTPEGNATNKTPQTLNVTLKVKR